jgi:hypothetical protein
LHHHQTKIKTKTKMSVPADQIVLDDYQIYATEYRQDVIMEVSAEDPATAAMIERVQNERYNDDSTITEDEIRAVEEAYQNHHRIVEEKLRQRYEQLPEAVKAVFIEEAAHRKKAVFRVYRDANMLIENAESLAAKAEDDALKARGVNLDLVAREPIRSKLESDVFKNLMQSQAKTVREKLIVSLVPPFITSIRPVLVSSDEDYF